MKLINQYKKIEINGLKDYYCDINGKIYEKKGDEMREVTISHPSACTKEYQRVKLKLRDENSDDYIWQPFSVAYLVCGTFRGWKHHSYKIIHIDGNRGNCKVDNLKWIPKKFDEIRKIIDDYNEKHE